MNNFYITLVAVATMLLYALPGYLLMKNKLVKPESISDFAKILMYMGQPCLTIYSFTRSKFSKDSIVTLLVFTIFSFLFQLFVLIVSFCVLTKINKEKKMRVCTVATALGNCGFLGMPLIETLLPEHPEAVIFSAIFSLTMNCIVWSIGSAMITGDKRYISAKKLLLNPPMIASYIAIPMFIFSVEIPVAPLNDAIAVVARMTTPLCMIIMGMRLGTMNFKKLFIDKWVYISVAIKQILMPLAALVILMLLPMEGYAKQAAFILCATPVASMTLNFAEMLGEGQETAANLVLFGTFFSIITIPIMMLLL